MDIAKNDYWKKLFGISDYPLRIKGTTEYTAYAAWGDLLRMFNLMTNGSPKTSNLCSDETDWISFDTSYREIKAKLSEMHSVQELADLAMNMTDDFMNKNIFFQTEAHSNILSKFEKRLRKSKMKYLEIISAYEELYVDLKDCKPSKNQFIRTGKFVLNDLLGKDEDLSRDITDVMKNIHQEIKDNSKDVGGNLQDDANIIYKSIMGHQPLDYAKHIAIENVYDLIIASAFLSSSVRSNPYALLHKRINFDEEEKVSINRDLTKKSSCNRNSNDEHIFLPKRFETLTDLENFSGHFSLRKLTEFLFTGLNDHSNSNILLFLIERFSQINFVNLLAPWAYKYEYTRGNTIFSSDESGFILDDITCLAVCPLVDFRLFVVRHLSRKLEKAGNDKSKLNKVCVHAHDIVKALLFVSLFYLPVLQIIFKTLLSIWYLINNKSFPVNRLIFSQKCQLFSLNKVDLSPKMFKPYYEKIDTNNHSYNKVIYFSYLFMYESLIFDNNKSFMDLLLQYKEQVKNLFFTKAQNPNLQIYPPSFCHFIISQFDKSHILIDIIEK